MIIGGVLPVLSNDAAEIKRLRKKLKAAVQAERAACEATLVELRNSTMCVCDGEGNLVGSYLQYEHDTIDKAIGALRARGKEGSDADKT